MYSAVASMCCISVLYCMPYAVSLCPIVCCFSVQIVCCIRLLYCMLYQCAILCAVSVCCIDCCISVLYCILCQCAVSIAISLWYIVCCVSALDCMLCGILYAVFVCYIVCRLIDRIDACIGADNHRSFLLSMMLFVFCGYYGAHLSMTTLCTPKMYFDWFLFANDCRFLYIDLQ